MVRSKNKIIIFLLIGLLIRLILVFISDFHPDVYNYIDWGNIFLKIGPRNFYSPNMFWSHCAPNQPILSTYLFAIIAFLNQILQKLFWFINIKIPIFPSFLIPSIISSLQVWLIKFPAVIADIFIGFYIFKLLEPKYKKIAIIASCLYLFNPAVIYNSALWGQNDSIISLFALLAFIKLFDKKYFLSFIFLFVSLFFKITLFIYVPIYLLILFSQKPKVKSIFLPAIYTFITALILSFPFSYPQNPFSWLINLFTRQVFSNQGNMLNGNAYNVWLLAYGVDITTQAVLWQKLLSYGIFLIILFFIGKKLFLKLNFQKTIFALFMVGFTAFIILTNMHERYLHPIFVLLPLLYAYYPKIFSIPKIIILSLLHLINLFQLWWYPTLPIIRLGLEANNYGLSKIFSFILIGYFIYFLVKYYQDEN